MCPNCIAQHALYLFELVLDFVRNLYRFLKCLPAPITKLILLGGLYASHDCSDSFFINSGAMFRR